MDQRILPTVNDGWPFLLGKSVDELRQSLLHATLELEYTRAAVKEEMERRDQQTKELLQLLEQACRERDEAHNKCNKLLENLLVQPETASTLVPPSLPQPPNFFVAETLGKTVHVLKGGADSATTSAESTDSISRNSSTSTVQSLLDLDFPDGRHYQIMSPPAPPPTTDVLPEVKGKLPEKGKLLQAVINAGPLLQTLLLAGPLPQWRHPPPPLDSLQIPSIAVSVSGGVSIADGPFVKRSSEAFVSDQNGPLWSIKDLGGPSF